MYFGEPPAGINLTAYDLDLIFAVPKPLRLRTIHIAALGVAALSLAGVIEWPRCWQLMALGDAAAASALFALAAGREWFLRGGPAF
ncbi:MAG TPA: hypothetical protein VNH11_00705 [Pirellulales bacterium]|nr:hypothetical protein [Pirellulales bacterium]